MIRKRESLATDAALHKPLNLDLHEWRPLHLEIGIDEPPSKP